MLERRSDLSWRLELLDKDERPDTGVDVRFDGSRQYRRGLPPSPPPLLPLSLLSVCPVVSAEGAVLRRRPWFRSSGSVASPFIINRSSVFYISIKAVTSVRGVSDKHYVFDECGGTIKTKQLERSGNKMKRSEREEE
ncbi:unnamed protein product [Danaus chrysippus]|uniref:(African queen) hypothetical protein n=1 Tax=Danaus chrysippus TaxID=151541 RepID=A0A8J2QTB2_9NEOP|nr:unnamed protein product [Danaus chrysippus]